MRDGEASAPDCSRRSRLHVQKIPQIPRLYTLYVPTLRKIVEVSRVRGRHQHLDAGCLQAEVQNRQLPRLSFRAVTSFNLLPTYPRYPACWATRLRLSSRALSPLLISPPTTHQQNENCLRGRQDRLFTRNRPSCLRQSSDFQEFRRTGRR